MLQVCQPYFSYSRSWAIHKYIYVLFSLKIPTIVLFYNLFYTMIYHDLRCMLKIYTSARSFWLATWDPIFRTHGCRSLSAVPLGVEGCSWYIISRSSTSASVLGTQMRDGAPKATWIYPVPLSFPRPWEPPILQIPIWGGVRFPIFFHNKLNKTTLKRIDHIDLTRQVLLLPPFYS